MVAALAGKHGPNYDGGASISVSSQRCAIMLLFDPEVFWQSYLSHSSLPIFLIVLHLVAMREVSVRINATRNIAKGCDGA